MKRFLEWLSCGREGRWIGKYYFSRVNVRAHADGLFLTFADEFGNYMLIGKKKVIGRGFLEMIIPLRLIKI